MAAEPASDYAWAHYLPMEDDYKEPDLVPCTHVEPASRVDPRAELTFLHRATAVTEIVPEIGTEIRGVQISSLSSNELDQMSLLLGRRKLLVFRGQDFCDKHLELQKTIVSHFGRLHVHPISDHVPGSREHLVFHRTAKADVFRSGAAANRLTTTLWHHDQSFELQPPSATFLTGLSIPKRSGGDTEYVSMVSAFNRLSPSFAGYLETLCAVHSGVEQAAASLKPGASGVLRRAPVESVHPVVRVHPGTGEKALFVNRAFTTRIVGLRQEESTALLELLYRFVETATEFHARVRWEDRTVIVWDNRITNHTVISDFTFERGDIRHHFRLTATGERPVGVKGKIDESQLDSWTVPL
ncbi:TauD-domain-containing protein [Geopyxis carbonaria]|nr:TauD-domain-containing protein [Geopyxis carbonaria]